MDGLLKRIQMTQESLHQFILVSLNSKGYKLYIYDPKVLDKKITTDLKDNEHLIKAKHNLEKQICSVDQ